MTFLAVIAAVTILKIEFSDPKITPDTRLFFRIADNIRLNGCLSQSVPSTATCEPAWGSQPPGYPMFLAVLRSVTLAPRLVIAVQAVIFTASAVALAFAFPYARRLDVATRVLILVVSPLTFAWGRWVLTETLAMSATMWTFAVMCRCLTLRHLNTLALAAALALAMLLRWDQICLLIPAVALIGILYPVRKAAVRAIVVVMLATLPYAALSLRAIERKLPAFPTNAMDLDMPPNIVRFWKTVALDQRATSGLIWETWSRHYDNVRALDFRSLSSFVPRDALTQLVDGVSLLAEGSQFPEQLDQRFGTVATEVASAHPIQTRLGIPIVRAVRLWTWPDHQFYSGWEGVQEWIYGEGWRTAYRVLLLLICGFAVVVRWRHPVRQLAILVALYVIGRTCFLVSPLTLLETRYLVETFPPLEFVAVVTVEQLIASRRADLPCAA
jgi:hypothetical protein